MVIFAYGMETAYFRFANNEDDKDKVFDTAFISLLVSSVLFTGLICVFVGPIASELKYTAHPEYIIWFAFILGLDALTSIPFAQLRYDNKPLRYAFFKMLSIGVNIGLTVFFVFFCPFVLNHDKLISLRPFMNTVYNPAIGIGYVFIANLVASVVTLLVMLPIIIKKQYRFSAELWKKMMPYAMPMLIVGTAGMVNETMDRFLLKHLLPLKNDEVMAQIGIYGACYKLSIVMTLFVQAFKMAAEPFFFSQAKEGNAQKIYADSMKYFIIICSFIFLGIMVYLDFFKHFIGKNYYEGLVVVPILLLANLCLGAYYNLSIWYKLTNKTNVGAYIAIFGATVTLLLNYIWIPKYGYLGSAWATFICYASMMVVSYIVGQMYYPVPYKLKSIFIYLSLALTLYFADYYICKMYDITGLFNYLIGSVCILIFVVYVFFSEVKKDKSQLGKVIAN
jgi:O-antigen/teichoic acid export membrane protein